MQRQTERNIFSFVLGILLGLFICAALMFFSTPAEAQEWSSLDEGTIVLNGVACRDDWRSVITVRASEYVGPGPQAIGLLYYAEEQPLDTWGVTTTRQGGGLTWEIEMQDLICEYFGNLGETSGCLIVSTDWPSRGWAVTHSSGYGSVVPMSTSVPRGATILLPSYDPTIYRMNVLFFAEDRNGALISIGAESVWIPPYQSVIRKKVSSGTRIVVGERTGGLHVAVSQVNNLTGDPANIPVDLLIELPE